MEKKLELPLIDRGTQRLKEARTTNLQEFLSKFDFNDKYHKQKFLELIFSKDFHDSQTQLAFDALNLYQNGVYPNGKKEVYFSR